MIGQIAFALLGVVMLVLPVPLVVWYHRNAPKYEVTMSDTLESFEIPGRVNVVLTRAVAAVLGREIEIERVSRT